MRVGDRPLVVLEQGDSANIPANAPHSFRNAAEVEARLLCTVVPSGLEKFFAEFGDPVATRTSLAPELSDSEREERLRIAMAKAPGVRDGVRAAAVRARGLTQRRCDPVDRRDQSTRK